MLDVTSTPVEPDAEAVPDALPLISRADAIKAGLLRYCTGEACTHGHHAERWVSSCHCCQCDRGAADYKGGPASTWHPDEDAIVRAQWGKISARDIGVMLQRSRNSVISRAHRIGLGESDYVRAPRPRRPRAATPPVTRERNTFGGMFTKLANAKRKKKSAFGIASPWTPEARIERTPMAPKLTIEPEPIPATACSIYDLTTETCRWPVGPETCIGQLFCGAPGADLAAGVAYCGFHAPRAYAPARWRP